MSELKLQQCRVDGRYDVLDCLGRGSYSEVYVARDVAATGSQPPMVVLKALNTNLQGSPDADLEQTLIENFRNEAIALDRVRHPNVINRLGHGTAIDLHGRVFHYLVLEYLPGGDMQQLCRQRPLKLEGALFYLRQVGAGLEHAHEHGVIHRDIKPQNLLLTADQHTVKIADFGVAKLEATTDGAITRVGTDIYAAPEHHPLVTTGQLDTSSLDRSNVQLTPAADIYSLAKTAYMLLTGESPRRFAHKPVTSLPLHLSSEPWADYVIRVLERATQTNPSKRHQSVREFWDDLQDAAMPRTKLLGGNGSEAIHLPGPLEGAAEEVPPAPPTPEFERPARRPTAERAHASQHARIVVPIGMREEPPRPPQRWQETQTPVVPPTEVIAHPYAERAATPPRMSGAAKRWLVALILIAAFSGMLLATHYYFRREPRRTIAPSPPNAPTGREFVATTDVNLRNAPNGEKRGKVPKDSVVKVLKVNGGWYEIQIVHYARPKENASDADQGWANGDFFREKQ